jgi:hypothetical protein
VFTARYALSPYIKQIRFVFKGLQCLVCEPHPGFEAPFPRLRQSSVVYIVTTQHGLCVKSHPHYC